MQLCLFLFGVTGDRTEARARVADALHDVQYVLERARQTVEPPDDNHVSLAQMVEQAMQLRPIPAPAGRGLLEQTAIPCRSERSGLQGVILFCSSPFEMRA